MSRKSDFAESIMRSITQIAQHGDRGDDAVTIYFDRGYNSGGADAIVDADLTNLGITAAELADGITLFQNLNKFINNDTPAQADYDVTLNKLRNDL